MTFDWIKSTAAYLSSRNKLRPRDRIQHEQINTVLSFIALSIVLGAAVVALARVGSVMIALMWAGAFCVVGWIVGFLFGIPRTVPHQAPVNTPIQAPAGEGPNAPVVVPGPDQQVNTNLEQISDWLTKILVGLGLSQINKIPGLISWLSKFVGGGIAESTPPSPGHLPEATAFAAAIFLYFTGVGFTGGYLLTRLILAGLFRGVDSPETLDSSSSQRNAVDVKAGQREADVVPANPATATV